jgi:hypothetical protein
MGKFFETIACLNGETEEHSDAARLREGNNGKWKRVFTTPLLFCKQMKLDCVEKLENLFSQLSV